MHRSLQNSRGGRDMGRKPEDLSVLEAVMRGAASGLIGGAALLVAARLEHAGILTNREGRGPRWDKRIRGLGRKAGLRLPRRGVTVAEIGGYLAFSAFLGALFGVARRRLPLTTAARALLESGFLY